MDEQWTADVAEDLQGMARLAGMQPITPAAQIDAWQPARTAADAERQPQDSPWHTSWRLLVVPHGPSHAPVAADPPATVVPPVVAVEQYLVGSWPAWKAKVVGFFRTWPANAPLMR